MVPHWFRSPKVLILIPILLLLLGAVACGSAADASHFGAGGYAG